MARHTGCFKPGLKPAQLYIRLSIIPLNHQSTWVSWRIIRHYVVAFAVLHFAWLDTRVLNSYQEKQIGYFQLLLWLQHFNSCPDNSISTPWLQRLYSFSTLQLFFSSSDLQHKGSFCLKLLIKFQIENYQYLHQLFVFPFNINRTLEPQRPFLYKWLYLPSCYRPYQVLPLRARVYLGTMTMKGYSAFPKAPALMEPHHQIVES